MLTRSDRPKHTFALTYRQHEHIHNVSQVRYSLGLIEARGDTVIRYNCVCNMATNTHTGQVFNKLI